MVNGLGHHHGALSGALLLQQQLQNEIIMLRIIKYGNEI